MKNINDKKSYILFIIVSIITIIVMCFFIGKKEGWHEDEIFSYGSSNYKYDHLFQRFGDRDSLNQLIDEKIIGSNLKDTLKNIKYYITHNDEFNELLNEKMEKEIPIWKTSEEAKEYMTVSTDEIFNYWSVYYNQARDVHPPLFYFLVHFVSALFLNNFSKYIIFIINLIFFVASIFIIRKIIELFNKNEWISSITILLYGLSMGAISTVIFQRMYIMLTFFVLSYLYLNLKIALNSFEIDKKTKRMLIANIILGFLTQYYFCIYIIFLFLVMSIIIAKNKKFKELKSYIFCHIKAAIIGIIIFPASIYHIFFSYRGAAGGVVNASYIERLKEYLKIMFYSFSIPEILGYIITGILIVLFIIRLIKGKKKDIILMICMPIILFVLTIVKISPFINIRYISLVFPIIVISIVLIILSITRYIVNNILCKFNNIRLSNFCKKNLGLITISIITISISIYGFCASKPEFLYEGYKRRIELAEKNQDIKLVYVGESVFNHLQDMEEFLRYKNYIILNTWELDELKEDEVLKEEKEFVLNIKCWISNFDENLNKILEYTNAEKYELLLDDGQSRVYKVSK